MVEVLNLPGGQVAVPGNRWDLAPDTGRLPFISVVIPYYDAREHLDLVLEGLARQDYSHFEIIVVDDGSPEPLSLPPGIISLRQSDKGFRAAAARNLGAAAAQGEVLCFLDQDTVPEPGYLRHLARLPAVLPDALVVGRRRHADLRHWSPARLRSWLEGDAPGPQTFDAPTWLADAYERSANLLHSDDTSYRFVISAVMGCSAVLFGELGGFDESFTGYGGEDWEFAFRAYNAGAVLAHEPAAVAWHDGPDWADRGDDDSRRHDQAEQRKALARLIPAQLLDDPNAEGPADLVVVWSRTAHVDPGRLRTEVRALLESPLRPVLYLNSDLDADLIADSRLRTGPVPADVLARALDLVELSGDCEPRPADLVRMRDELRAGTVGRVVVPPRRPGGTMTGTSLRALRRAARWQPFSDGNDLVEAFFGSRIAIG